MLLTVLVTAACVQDRDAAKPLTGNFPHLEGSNQPPSAA